MNFEQNDERLGEHKWQDCQEYARRTYLDNRVGQVWARSRRPGSESLPPDEFLIEIRCDKCGKEFLSPDDPQIAKEPTDIPRIVPEPVSGTLIRRIDGSTAGRVLIVIGPVSSVFPNVYEVVPDLKGWSSVLSVVIRRAKIKVLESHPDDPHLRTRYIERYTYVICDRRTHLLA